MQARFRREPLSSERPIFQFLHAGLVDSYRSANAIATRASQNNATTEELRTAMIHFRALFDELLQVRSRTDTRAIA